MEKKTWNEFRNTGLLCFVNTFLHIFGWAIVIASDDSGNVSSVYPAKVNYTGFSEKSYEKNYAKVRSMLKDGVVPADQTEDA